MQCILWQGIEYTIYPDTGYIAFFSQTNIDIDVGVHNPERKNDCNCVTEADCCVVVVLQHCVHILVDV
jgi:hypothetical protein